MVVIKGLATIAPDISISQELAVSHAKRFSCRDAWDERVLERLYRYTEIASRRSVLGHDLSGSNNRFFQPPNYPQDRGPGTAERMERYVASVIPLAVKVSQEALCIANVSGEKISHLVTVTCTGFFAPGFDIALIKDLKLSSDVLRTQVGFMGCHGAINGLRVASSIVAADPDAHVLLCAAELCSIHFQYGWHKEHLVANSIFADGAGAVVVCAGDENGGGRSWQIISSKSRIIPNSQEAMSWLIGDHGFYMTLSPRVPDLISENLFAWLYNWLCELGLTFAHINNWAVHPGGPRILDTVAKCLDVSPDNLGTSRQVLRDYGNMSSPTVLFILNQLPNSPGYTIMLGFGPGLAMEAILLKN